MREQDLIEKKRELEFENCSLRAELADLDTLMRMAGFSNGLETVKITAQEIVRYSEDHRYEIDDDLAA